MFMGSGLRPRWSRNDGRGHALFPSGGALASACIIGAITPGSSFLGAFTRVETGQRVMGLAGYGSKMSGGTGSLASHGS